MSLDWDLNSNPQLCLSPGDRGRLLRSCFFVKQSTQLHGSHLHLPCKGKIPFRSNNAGDGIQRERSFDIGQAGLVPQDEDRLATPIVDGHVTTCLSGVPMHVRDGCL